MDCLDRSPGQFRNFKRDDFDGEWIKVTGCRFGQVYQVNLKLWREKCALKVLDTALNAESFRRLEDEMCNIAQGKFPYLITMYGMCREVNAVVMKYMRNGSLNNLLNSHTLMWPKKFLMIHEASMGMNFLHGMQPPFLHLNLKTSNILLDDHLHVKISDFGLIKWEEGMSKKLFVERLTARGNISYIPPESFSQTTNPPGTAFDVYSFGVVMWEILTQQKPNAGSSVTNVLLNVSNGKRLSMKLVPDRRPPECNKMIDIMNRCWDQEPRQRPQFSDITRETGGLSQIHRIQGSKFQCVDNVEEEKRNQQQPVYPAHKVVSPEIYDLNSEERCDEKGLLSLLLKKDFSRFRDSVKKEHISSQFLGEKSILHYTVAGGDAKSVECVLSLGADVNCTTTRGYTPLIIAALHRYHDIASLLLTNGANVVQGDEDQWTALHFSAQNGDDRTTRLLLDKGAVADACEKSGWMPLHLACQNGHEAVVRLLLSRLPDKAVEEREQGQNRTPLHLASAYGHINIVKLLLSKKADPNAADRCLFTALHLSTEEGHNRVVRELMKSGACVDSADSKGYTPLHYAALRGHPGICRQLLSKEAKPNSTTHKGWTPMHLAALHGRETTIAQLEDQGGCVNARGEHGWTPLHLACHKSEEGVVGKLLEVKADPNLIEDNEGWTPLHVACTTVSFPNVLKLLSHHADVNAMSSRKLTPLHLAAQHGSVPIVEALLANGADRTLLDSSGSTPLNLAQRCEKWEVVQMLEK